MRESRPFRALLIGISSFAVILVLLRVFVAKDFSNVRPLERFELVNEISSSSRLTGSGSRLSHPMVVDGKVIRRIEEVCLGGFIDWHYAYRIECDRAVWDDVLSGLKMTERSDSDLRQAFRRTYADVFIHGSSPYQVFATESFETRGRGGPDGEHFAATYDEACSTLYIIAHFNF